MDEFRIISSELLNRHFESLCAQAELEGRGPAALAAAEAVMRELSSDPLSVGETLYHLGHSGLPVRHIVRSPWSFHFVVDEPRRLVYLTRIALLS